MVIKPEEVSWVIQQEIEAYAEDLQLHDSGRVLQIGDGIARVFGLDAVMMSELVTFSNGTLGMVLNLEVDQVGIILLGPDQGIKEHDLVKRTGKIASIPVGEALLGRVVNPLGIPLDGKSSPTTTHFLPLESPAPQVVQREPVCEPLFTGIKAIDAMIPIGKGQRELIIGDRQTGKTALILDTIINQKNQGIHCIYVAIGQKASTIFQTVKILEDFDAMEHTTVVAATASDPAPLQYIAPYAGAAMGEYYMRQGKHAICFYDDLSKHAVSYRQLSLLLRRPAGREAYPGDIFYLHARLLERAAKMNAKHGGGSLTAIPVIETQANDLTTYIPTNVISITDGQIYLEGDLFHAGIRPAINVGISVSRVGGKAQAPALKQVAGSLRLDLAQYLELSAFAQFRSELDESTQGRIIRGERVRALLNQDRFTPLSVEKQAMIIYIGTQGLVDDIPLEAIGKFEKAFYAYIDQHYPQIARAIYTHQAINEQTAVELVVVTNALKKEFQDGRSQSDS
jgi:F-type H+/Na+-transporting ATPase subunit alpha